MLRAVKHVPLLRLVVLGQLALLERSRLLELARRPHKLSSRERKELRSLGSKLEPGAFAKTAATTVAPFGGRRAKRR
jgi:hypothetical protein